MKGFFPLFDDTFLSPSTFLPHRCLQNYIPAHSLTLSCPVCRQTSILPEKGVSALQNNFFITNLMDVLQRTPDNSIEESSILETVTAVAAGKPLSCPNHDGNVSETASCAITGIDMCSLVWVSWMSFSKEKAGEVESHYFFDFII